MDRYLKNPFLEQYLKVHGTLLQQVVDAVFVLSPDGAVLSCNRQATELLRLPAEELVQKNLFDYLPDAVSAERVRGILKDVSRNSGKRFECKISLDEEHDIDLYFHVAPLVDESGVLQGILMFCSDITILKLLEDRNRKLARFPMNSPDLVCQTNLKGEVLYLNPTFERFVDEAPERLEKFEELFSAHFTGVHWLDGEKIHFEEKVEGKVYNFSCIPYQQDDVVYVYSRDVTHYIELEDENRAYSEHLEEIIAEEVKVLESTQVAAIMAIAKLAEMRDTDTGRHIERVKEFSRILGYGLKENPKYAKRITATFLDRVVMSSMLHDVGKVGIEDSILLKPARLTPEEFEKMRQHTIIGGKALEEAEKKILEYDDSVESFLVIGKEVAYSHHEWYDGSGYPYGLKGDDIPLSARIVALADVFDALSSKRVYKSAFTYEDSFAIIKDLRGKQFDPDLVDVFEKYKNEIFTLAKELKD